VVFGGAGGPLVAGFGLIRSEPEVGSWDVTPWAASGGLVRRFFLVHGSSRIDAESSFPNRSILGCSAESKPAIADVRQLPNLISIIFGGAPRKIESSTKSSSLVAKTKFISAAKRQMTSSSPPKSPTSRTCAEDA
jgi:hypothetical protein